MELYDVSLFGGSVITTYFDLDGNEVQESEIDYDHMELINTETLGGIFGTLTPPDSIIEKPEAKNQIPEIVTKVQRIKSYPDWTINEPYGTNFFIMVDGLPWELSKEEYAQLKRIRKTNIEESYWGSFWNALWPLYVTEYEFMARVKAGARIYRIQQRNGYNLLHGGTGLSQFEYDQKVRAATEEYRQIGRDNMRKISNTADIVMLGTALVEVPSVNLILKRGVSNAGKPLIKVLDNIDNLAGDAIVNTCEAPRGAGNGRLFTYSQKPEFEGAVFQVSHAQFDEYMHFRNQGFTPAQAKYLTQPYGKRAGHHFPIPQRVGRAVLPDAVVDSRFNVLRPRGISLGRFYELHYRVDPYFNYARFPRSIGGGWNGNTLGLERYSGLQRIWYATPGPTKVAGGTGIIVVGAGGYWWFSSGDDGE